MRPRHEVALLSGAAGVIETIIETKATECRGIALVAHPHPLFGGANTNKVAQALARSFLDLGYISLRPNFRGVGQSAGVHDEGVGETDDMLTVLHAAYARFGHLPTVLCGFSFGAYVQTRVAARLQAEALPIERMVLVGTAAGFIEGARHYETGAVPPDTLVIHGGEDTTVPLTHVLSWAEPLSLPVVVVPGADHFFHHKLHLIRDIVRRAWHS